MPMRLINKLKSLLEPDSNKIKDAFGKALVMAHESKVYQEFCEKTHRLTFPIFNLIDLPQYELLIDTIKEDVSDHFLDIGCGLGYLTLSLDSKTGKKGFGFDFSSEAINIANDLREGRFFVSDYNNIDIDLPETKLFISVDGFYFVKDYKKFFNWLKKVSNNEGKLILLRTDLEMNTGLYKFLKKEGFLYKITDLTSLEIAYWDRVQKVLPEFKKKHDQEGTLFLYEIKEKEMHKHLSFIKNNKLSRSLVEISW